MAVVHGEDTTACLHMEVQGAELLNSIHTEQDVALLDALTESGRSRCSPLGYCTTLFAMKRIREPLAISIALSGTAPLRLTCITSTP